MIKDISLWMLSLNAKHIFQDFVVAEILDTAIMETH